MTAVPGEDGEIMADASVGKTLKRAWKTSKNNLLKMKCVCVCVLGGGGWGGWDGSESVMEETTTNLQHV